jgi:hypothetical protein
MLAEALKQLVDQLRPLRAGAGRVDQEAEAVGR